MLRHNPYLFLLLAFCLSACTSPFGHGEEYRFQAHFPEHSSAKENGHLVDKSAGILLQRMEILDFPTQIVSANHQTGEFVLGIKHKLSHLELINILTSTGKLEFREGHSFVDGQNELKRLDRLALAIHLHETDPEGHPDNDPESIGRTRKELKTMLEEPLDSQLHSELNKELHPILGQVDSVYQLDESANNPLMGYCRPWDTLVFRNWLRNPGISSIRKKEYLFAYSIYPIESEGEFMELFALKDKGHFNPAHLTNLNIEEVTVNPGTDPQQSILVKMDAEGTEVWAEMTTKNVDRSIAILLDGKVFSCVKVNEAILKGETYLNWNYSKVQTRYLQALIQTPPLPAAITEISSFR